MTDSIREDKRKKKMLGEREVEVAASGSESESLRLRKNIPYLLGPLQDAGLCGKIHGAPEELGSWHWSSRLYKNSCDLTAKPTSLLLPIRDHSG